MVADFTGTLEEGEVHLSFSTKFHVDGFSDTCLEEMDILVARNPAHFPSDIQRVRAVSKPKLRKLKDVIVFSMKGSRPLADLLSGGDYDGDRAWICWDQELVQNFQNQKAPPDYNFVKEGYLEKFSLTFNELLESHYNDVDAAACDFIERMIAFSTKSSLLGFCTKYKEKFCYHSKSIGGHQAELLSALLSSLVDQAKDGVIFTFDDWNKFCKNRLQVKGSSLPDPEYWNEKVDNRVEMKKRDHVLDHLKFQVAVPAIVEAKEMLWQSLETDKPDPGDQDLSMPYKRYREAAIESSFMGKFLDQLRADIISLRRVWAGQICPDNSLTFMQKMDRIYHEWLDIKPVDNVLPPEASLMLASSWTLPEPQDGRDGADGWSSMYSPWALLKASATYYICKNSNMDTFIWYTAGRQLALIKSQRTSSAAKYRDTGPVWVVPEMWAISRPDKKLVARMCSRRGDESESIAALDEVADFDDDGVFIDDV
jgi:hypothetical protein